MTISILKEFDNVIFDLDGTLIDSKASVLASLKFAFEHKGMLDIDYSKFVLGPPLAETIKKLAPFERDDSLQEIASLFKEYYDDIGYKESCLFEGVEDLLSDLQNSDKRIILVTNKRSYPTEKIIEMFPVFKVFQSSYSLDSFRPVKQCKSEVIASMLVKESIMPENSVYVGDTDADRVAAHLNLLDFVLMNHHSKIRHYPV